MQEVLTTLFWTYVYKQLLLSWINLNNIVIVQNHFSPQKLVKNKLTAKINYFLVGKFNLKRAYFQSHKFDNTTNIYTNNLNLK